MSEPTFNKNSELLANLQSLKQHPGYQYIMDIVSGWEIQANEAVMMKTEPQHEDEYRGEWKAYRRVSKLLDKATQDLQTPTPKTDLSDFDAYQE